jgi:hypothetical protein
VCIQCYNILTQRVVSVSTYIFMHYSLHCVLALTRQIGREVNAGRPKKVHTVHVNISDVYQVLRSRVAQAV